MEKSLFSPIFTENHVKNISEDIFDFDQLETTYHVNCTEFLDEYKRTICELEKSMKYEDCSETAKNALIVLRLIEINAFLKLDIQLLVDSLKVLANMIEWLETVYRNDEYENYSGMVIAYKMNIKVCKVLHKERNESKEHPDPSQLFIVHAISQIPVTNTTLAHWNYSAFRHYGMRVNKNVNTVIKAMYFYDHILGSGISEMLLNHTKEAVEKKLKPLNDVGLHSLSEKILEFYSCKTGNEKRRFLSDIEDVVESVDINKVVNAFLSDNCSKK